MLFDKHETIHFSAIGFMVYKRESKTKLELVYVSLMRNVAFPKMTIYLTKKYFLFAGYPS
jgi:hypothetical protein